MPIQTVITDAQSRLGLRIGPYGELYTSAISHPPLNEQPESFPFSSWFENAGSNNMRVNGSVTPVLFRIDAVADYDIFVKTISVRISDTGATLDKFGALTALTNGISFVYSTPKTGEIIIQDEIKTNLSFIRLAQNTVGVGGGTDAFKSDISGGGADTYLPVINMSATFGYPWGLHLKKGTNASVGFYVNDNLSAGLNQFDIKGFGIQI